MACEVPRARAGQQICTWPDLHPEADAWYLDAADGYVPLGEQAGAAHVLLHSRFDDPLETGWLGLAAFARNGEVADVWTGQDYVQPSPSHVVGWRLNQTQRHHVLRSCERGGGALIMVQNRHRQETQSVALLVSGANARSANVVWCAERSIPPGSPDAPRWELHHADRFYPVAGGDAGGPIAVLARQHAVAGAARSALGLLTADAAGRKLTTAWVGEPAFAPASPGGCAWRLAAGDRLQVLPPLGPPGRVHLLGQNRDPGAAGRARLAVLSCDLAGSGLRVEWSAQRNLSGAGGARRRMNASDRYTIAGCLPSSRRCLVLVQSPGTDGAAGPSIAVLSVDIEAGAVRLESALSGVIPPARKGEPGWRIDRADELHSLGRPNRDGASKILVHRRARERHERQRLAVLSLDAAGLRTEWVAGEKLPARHAASRGWRPDPLDRIHVLPGAGPDRCKLLVQSRPLAEPDLSRVGVVSLRAQKGLLTEQVFEHALFAPSYASR